MQTLKKIKLLILDDRPKSMESVLCCALPHEGLQVDEVMAALERLLDIKRFHTVSSAIEGFNHQKPDLVFTDLKIETIDETNPEVLKEHYHGIYFINWVRKNHPANLPLKIHSMYWEFDEVELYLNKAGIGILSYFPIDDHLAPGEKLKRNFPRFLREIAQKYLEGFAKKANGRRAVREIIETAIHQKNLDTPIPRLGNFSIRTLMVGWMCLKEENDKAIIDWHRDPSTAIKELMKPSASVAKKRSVDSVVIKHMIDDLTKLPDYRSLSHTAQTQALEVIQEFLQKWGKYVPGEVVENPVAMRLESCWLTDSKQNIERLKKVLLNEKEKRPLLVRALRWRLIIGGIYELRHRFTQPFQEKIVDYTILGCIRNDFKEVQRYLVKPQTSQTKKYLSVLGLGKESAGTGQHQILKKDLFYEDELTWMSTLK